MVSIIIPTYNREKCILDLINSLSVQDFEAFEILIIDQSDIISNEKKTLLKDKRIRIFTISERGRSLAKNIGISLAKGDIIIFCDDDIIVPSNFISTHVRNYKNPTIGAVSCRIVEDGQPAIEIKHPLKITSYGRLINKAFSTRSGKVTSLNGGNMSFRNEALVKAGYFEEDFVGTSMVEEPDIAYRVMQNGYTLYFDASITVEHYPQYNGNIAELKKKRSDWFYNYFFNLSTFYFKYGRYANLPLLMLYSFALSLKNLIIYKVGLKSFFFMQKGFFRGLKKGYKLHVSNQNNIYYTPRKNFNILIKEVKNT